MSEVSSSKIYPLNTHSSSSLVHRSHKASRASVLWGLGLIATFKDTRGTWTPSAVTSKVTAGLGREGNWKSILTWDFYDIKFPGWYRLVSFPSGRGIETTICWCRRVTVHSPSLVGLTFIAYTIHFMPLGYLSFRAGLELFVWPNAIYRWSACIIMMLWRNKPCLLSIWLIKSVQTSCSYVLVKPFFLHAL